MYEAMSDSDFEETGPFYHKEERSLELTLRC